MFTKLKSYLSNHPLILISIAYFIFRLVNLTNLPIFNDEAIYMDWAWRMTNEPGELFYSLYDAKQPLLMWVFGIFQHLLPNAFFAARFASVICGWLVVIGIYKIGKTYFSEKLGILASFLYIVVPIFSFYDRQALMESGVAAVGVWTVWFAMQFWRTAETKKAVYTGILLGVGFFIKSSSLIFLLTFFLISFWLYFKKRNLRVHSLFYSLCSFLSVISLLLLQPKFWETLSSNSRYGFGLYDLVKFPVISWATNLVGDGEIGLLFLTPVVFVFSFVGIILLLRKGKEEQYRVTVWTIVMLLLQVLLVRSTSQRYLVSYLPVLVLFASYGVFWLQKRYLSLFQKYVLWCLLFLLPIILTAIQILDPISYFRLYSRSRFSENSYVNGRTSGYGIDKAIAAIEKLPKGKRIFVGESLYTGTPESAIMVWFEKSPVVTTGYLDRRLLGDSINGVDCIKADVPVYFVSKGNDVAGLEKFLINISYLKNPYNDNIIGIWKMKDKCEGKMMQVRLVNIR